MGSSKIERSKLPISFQKTLLNGSLYSGRTSTVERILEEHPELVNCVYESSSAFRCTGTPLLRVCVSAGRSTVFHAFD